MRRTEPEPDYLLWGLLTLTIGTGGALGQRAFMPQNSLVDCCSRIAAGERGETMILIAVATAIFILAGAASAGWFAHRLANAIGLRLTGRPASSQAEDYEDSAHTRPSQPVQPPVWLWWVQTAAVVFLLVAGSAIVVWLLMRRAGGLGV